MRKGLLVSTSSQNIFRRAKIFWLEVLNIGTPFSVASQMIGRRGRSEARYARRSVCAQCLARAAIVRVCFAAQSYQCRPSHVPIPRSFAMSDDDLDRLIAMEPDSLPAAIPAMAAQPHSALRQHGVAEPFAAPRCESPRLLPLRLVDSPASTPCARQHHRRMECEETPPPATPQKRRLSGKQSDTLCLYAGKAPKNLDKIWRQSEVEFLRAPARARYLGFMYRLRKWLDNLEPTHVPEALKVPLAGYRAEGRILDLR